MYHYSSDDRDLSNNPDYARFFEHYEHVVRELFRVTKPGRMTAVHCMDVPSGNSGCDHMIDFPGDIIRMHERIGFRYTPPVPSGRSPSRSSARCQEPRAQDHRRDSSRCSNASADYLLVFRRKGENRVPIAHPSA